MATSPPDIAACIETFVRRHFRVSDRDGEFTRDAHLFEQGYVDSAGVVELLMFLESTFAVTLDDEQIFSELFTTINGIATLLGSRQPGSRELRAAVR
jgi:acyl carrier protein